MTTIAAPDAKAKFSELLDRVERGEEIVITRDGKPAARLVRAEGLLRPAGKKGTAEDIRAISERFRALLEGQETVPPGYDKGPIDLARLREVADTFRSQMKQPFSSQDINDLLYDEDGLPK